MKKIVPQYFTFAEMQAKFPDSWILVANPVSEAGRNKIT